jgi:phage shock protein E
MGSTIAPPSEVKRALEDPNTYVLDVRTPEEISESGRVHHKHWSQVNGTPDSCPDLESHPERYVEDKAATIVVYCRSGRRAERAKQVLVSKGYTGTILNGGGYDQLKSILPEQ